MRIYYFGVWEQSGHHWAGPGGNYAYEREVQDVPFKEWIDGGYAPRRFKDGYFGRRSLVKNPMCCFAMECKTADARMHVGQYDTEEFAQGEFLIHKKAGWTLMSWWDRTHGDTRGACNSSIVAQGDFEDHQMFDLLAEHFPKIADDLAKAGVVLKNVTPR